MPNVILTTICCRCGNTFNPASLAPNCHVRVDSVNQFELFICPACANMTVCNALVANAFPYSDGAASLPADVLAAAKAAIVTQNTQIAALAALAAAGSGTGP